MQKAKWLSEEVLLRAEKREAKDKSERERYTQLSTECQRIAGRDKRAFLSEECKETEETNRMGKNRELFKKIGNTNGKFHAKMGTIKDIDGQELIEAEKIKKRRQECTELYKNYLNDPDNHDGVVTHLEPDILECKVEWTLGNINTDKASGDDGIPAELFQILNDDAVKVLHSVCWHIWKTQHWPQD